MLRNTWRALDLEMNAVLTETSAVQNHNTLYQLGQPGSINAVHLEEPLSAYEMMSALLVPMFAARSAEEAIYGPKGVTLSTSKEVNHIFSCGVAKLCQRIMIEKN